MLHDNGEQPLSHERSKPHSGYRSDIDGLRAVAILPVLGFHAFPEWIHGGFIGVDIFFVVSGFLISGIIMNGLDEGRFTFSGFYGRRIRRIFPALLLVLVASYLFGWIALFADEYSQLGKHVASGAGFISNFVLLHEAGYFDVAAEVKPLLHLWSLGIEEQFYIIWPLFLWGVWKTRVNPFYVLVSGIAVSLAFGVIYAYQHKISGFYSPLSRFWELLIGALLAYLLVVSRSPWRQGFVAKTSKKFLEKAARFKDELSFVGFGLIVVGLAIIRREDHFPGWLALLPTLGAFLLLIVGPLAAVNRVLLSNRIMVWIGLISYPLYIWHWPLLSFSRIVEGETPKLEIRVAAVLASFVLAGLTYVIIEKPIRFGQWKREKAIALCSLMAIIGSAGFATWKHKGFENREVMVAYGDAIRQLQRTPKTDEACVASIGIKDPLFTYCRYNDVHGAETVALIGDSHAHANFPGFADELAKQGKNLLLLANRSCPPLLGAVTGENEEERKQCREKIDQIIKLVVGREDIRSVFITSRGPVYLTGRGFGATNPVFQPLRAFGDDSEAQKSDIVFKSSLQNSVDALRKGGKRVYYILENPETGIDPRLCISRPFREAKASCGISEDLVRERQGSYRRMVQDVKGATIIDPLPAFCTDGFCRIMEGKNALYADGDHFSIAGSFVFAKNVLPGCFKTSKSVIREFEGSSGPVPEAASSTR